MDGGAWWSAVHGVANSWTQLSNFTFTFHFPALEKEMAIHSSVLAWRIPGTGEPGGLPSLGSHRVRLKRLSSSSSIRLYKQRGCGVSATTWFPHPPQRTVPEKGSEFPKVIQKDGGAFSSPCGLGGLLLQSPRSFYPAPQAPNIP